MVRRFPAIITDRGVGITCALFIPSSPKKFLPSVTFIIDTGADKTQINEVETEKLGLD